MHISNEATMGHSASSTVPLKTLILGGYGNFGTRIARALAQQPQVILADEPTASLDDTAASAALRLLADTAARLRASLVIATHDARVAAALPGTQLCRLAGLPSGVEQHP